MKVDDRSTIAEHLIYQLWERDYFSTLALKTYEGHEVTIISRGTKNEDAGPDFKDIAIKLNDKIYHGDLEIHRAPEDWYQHCHHADPAYNNVIMHLVIGPTKFDDLAIRLNRHPVMAQVFVDITEEQLYYLTKRYHLSPPQITIEPTCNLSTKEETFRLTVINYFSRQRFQDKVDRFIEQRQTCSWNQILYLGIMEALGYSKNQIPFRKLAQLLPFEALVSEFRQAADESAQLQPLGILFGLAGLLPSQNAYFDWRKIKDQETRDYVPMLEEVWRQFHERLGLQPMRREEWQFFRLRPANFPTRRLAGAGMILKQFVTNGILMTILNVIHGLRENPNRLTRELEHLFICSASGYWTTHYQLDDAQPDLISEKTTTLIGSERARDIVLNVVLPVVLAYAKEINDARLETEIIQLYTNYPRISLNSILKQMSRKLFGDHNKANQFMDTAAKQQGLIHLYKSYCYRQECYRCQKEWENIRLNSFTN